jgi:GNAT superfamily N-acetyltransferase
VIAFANETVAQVLHEIEPLLQAHWEEIASYKDKVPLAPDYDQYRMLETAGKLLICTARDGGRLIGYSVYLVHRGIHYSKNLMATNDVFYIVPEYRLKVVGGVLTAVALLEHAEKNLRARGVSVISLHIKVWKDWSSLAERQGYRRVEYIHQKFLG